MSTQPILGVHLPLDQDIIALVVQGIGGGMASSAAGSGRDPSLVSCLASVSEYRV